MAIAIICFIVFLIGLLLLIIFASVKRKHTRCCEEARGTLMKTIRTTNDTERTMYIYSYRVDGVEYQLKSYDKSREVSNIGDHCTIWYNPKKPKDAMAFRYKSNKVFNIFIIVGIVMMVLTFVLPIIGAAMSALQR